MKKLTIRLAAGLLLLSLIPVTARAQALVAVGEVVGLELRNGTVTVAALDEGGSAAGEAGILPGDVILSIDGRAVSTGQDVKNALSRSNGTVSVRFLRKGREQALTLQPEITAEGPKLGVFLRQGVTGIGTVTYYDPETGAFATLGHGVNGSGGSLLKMTDGRAYPARVVSVKKGRSGAPGQLMGTVDSPESNGELTANTARGVFGKSSTGWQGKTLETASAEEVRTGTATILSTVSGDSVQEYSVEILKLYPKARTSGRNMLIRVTDPALLDATGGIVQGMSGSPIIQDGKLIGAVTHVLVNDPTMGYGIFIENMLEAAS
jgi:stage IV sporulation protein B